MVNFGVDSEFASCYGMEFRVIIEVLACFKF